MNLFFKVSQFLVISSIAVKACKMLLFYSVGVEFIEAWKRGKSTKNRRWNLRCRITSFSFQVQFDDKQSLFMRHPPCRPLNALLWLEASKEPFWRFDLSSYRPLWWSNQTIGVKKSQQSLLNIFQSFCLWFPFPFQLIVNKTQLGNESNGNIDLTALQTIIAIINEFGFW